MTKKIVNPEADSDEIGAATRDEPPTPNPPVRALPLRGGGATVSVRDAFEWFSDPQAALPRARELAALAKKIRPLASLLGARRGQSPFEALWSLCGDELERAAKRKSGLLAMSAGAHIALARLEAAARQHDASAREAQKEGTS